MVNGCIGDWFRNWILHCSCEKISTIRLWNNCTIWLYYLFFCRLMAMPTSQCTLHCPSVERNKLVRYCCLLYTYLIICQLIYVCVQWQFASPGPRARACRWWGGVERNLLHPLKVDISQLSFCLTTWKSHVWSWVSVRRAIIHWSQCCSCPQALR